MVKKSQSVKNVDILWNLCFIKMFIIWAIKKTVLHI